MSTISPRKDEIDELVRILEPEGTDGLDPEQYEDARAMAGDLLKVTFGILRRRTWWVVGHQPGPDWVSGKLTVIYGIEPSEFAAEKLGRSLGYGIYTLARVHGAGALEVDMAAHEEAARIKFNNDVGCARCGHLAVHHGATKLSRGRTVADLKRTKVSCSANCHCVLFVT